MDLPCGWFSFDRLGGGFFIEIITDVPPIIIIRSYYSKVVCRGGRHENNEEIISYRALRSNAHGVYAGDAGQRLCSSSENAGKGHGRESDCIEGQ